MAIRRRTYVAFDGDEDMHYFRLMKAWKTHEGSSFDLLDAHDLKQSRDTSSEETIKRSLRKRLRKSTVFVLLIGRSTKFLYRFVMWEIETALKIGLPIIGVNLNGTRRQDPDLCPPILRDQLAIYVSFNAKIIEHAIDHWPDQCLELGRQGVSGPYYYNDSIYARLAL